MDAGFQDRWIKPLSHPSDILDFEIFGRTGILKLTEGTFSTGDRKPYPRARLLGVMGGVVRD